MQQSTTGHIVLLCLDLLFSPVNHPSIPGLLTKWNQPVSSWGWESRRAPLLANKVKTKCCCHCAPPRWAPLEFLFSFCARSQFSNLKLWLELQLRENYVRLCKPLRAYYVTAWLRLQGFEILNSSFT